MATPYSIKNVADNAKSSKSSISGKKSGFDSKASSVSHSWQGEGGSAFSDAYRRIRGKVDALVTDYNSLGTKLTTLSNSVKRAEADKAKKK